jgi:hypothetical protein
VNDESAASTSFKVTRYGPFIVFPIYLNGTYLDATISLTSEQSFISEVGMRAARSIHQFSQRSSMPIPVIAGDDGVSRFVLTSLRVYDQAIRDVQVVVASRLDRLPFDIILGLDFLRQYARICYDPHDASVSLGG